jgi:hypothetical protein
MLMSEGPQRYSAARKSRLKDYHVGFSPATAVAPASRSQRVTAELLMSLVTEPVGWAVG